MGLGVMFIKYELLRTSHDLIYLESQCVNLQQFRQFTISHLLKGIVLKSIDNYNRFKATSVDYLLKYKKIRILVKSFKNSKRSKEQKVQKTLYRISVKDRYNKRSELSRVREADQMSYYTEERNNE